MASHHHFCHHSAPAAGPAACNCHCCYTYAPCHHLHHPPPPPPALHQPHYYPDPINLPNPPHFRELHLDRSFEDGRPSYAAVSSLLRRISALESALRRRTPPASASHSLRDAAARSIQNHFRAFLCRRSRTLRQLQYLAAIKSTLGNFKSLISRNPQCDYDAVYRKTVNLLLKLDAIQGDDPLIRNGKSSLTTDLNKFLDLIDAICVEQKGQSIGVTVRCRGGDYDLKSRVSNVDMKLGNLNSKGVNVEKLRALVERIDKLAEEIDDDQGQEFENPNKFLTRRDGDLRNKLGGLVRRDDRVGSKVKKNVSFVENGIQVYRVPRRPREPLLEEYCDEGINGDNVVVVSGEREIEDDVGREIDESSKEADDEDVGDEEEELHLPDVEKGSTSYLTGGSGYGRTRFDDDGVDDFVFRPPLPVKMERRGEATDKRMKTPK